MMSEGNPSTPSPIRFLVASNNLFFPLYGGGDKALLDWLIDLKDMGHVVVLLTSFPEIEGYEKELPFEIIRLTARIPFDPKMVDLKIEEMDGNIDKTLKDEFGVDVNDKSLLEAAIAELKTHEEFDYYIGWGPWGTGWEIGPWQIEPTLAKIFKDNFPFTPTIHLAWDLHSEHEPDTECDMFLHGAPYELIRNPNATTFYNNPNDNKTRLHLTPKHNTFEPIAEWEWSEWLERPYDYIFNNPLIYKGSPIVINLALNYPNKKFLVKCGNWGFSMGYSNYQYWLEQMEALPNIDIVKFVENMETEFFRKGRYLLYPSVSEGFGLMPLEAAMQGTIPLCADTNILRHSSAPFAEFVYSDAYTFTPIALTNGWNGISHINFDSATVAWLDKINFLDTNIDYVKSIWMNLRYVEDFVDKRYDNQFKYFIHQMSLF